MDAERLLQVVKGACDRAGSRWAVIGGIAMNAYGYARATVDFDIVAEEQHRARLVDALAGEGFRALNDVEGFTNLLHADPALGRLDVMWLERRTAERVLDRARPLRESGGLMLLVPAPEHLAAMKVRSIQCQPTRVFRDGSDLQHLLALPEADHNEVRGYFEKAGLGDLYERLRAPGEPLDLELLPSATGTAAAALESQRPGGLPYREYFAYLKQFSRTAEQLSVLPLSTGSRFTLD